MQRREFLALGAATVFCPFGHAETPKDSRPVKTLNDYFPFDVPKTLADWEKRRERLREQILVATGLWPLPERTPLNAVIHSPIDREQYTIEKVYFASRPGHYVTGNLYKPKKMDSPRPGVLFAHGHWAKGRFMESSAKEIKEALESKGEATETSAKYHMQAACSTLARRGYVVFQYDMIGYADSTALAHGNKTGSPPAYEFADAEAELRLQSLMGLQTWNSLRAIDFIISLPNVDGKKIGMTGGSGGGTQTFIAAAIDDRVACAVPAVMVSTGMQGGCVCENCSLLRVGTGNVEIAACIAPRPLALTGANDWTKEIMTKGYPELQKLFTLYKKKENVLAKAWLEYGHNYNQHAREFMYGWFAKHLEGKEETVSEPPFEPVPPKELSVFDAEHPRPKDELKAKDLRTAIARSDELTIEKLPLTIMREQREKMGLIRMDEVNSSLATFSTTALRAMVCDELPAKVVIRDGPKASKVDGCTVHRAWLGRPDEADVLPTAGAFDSNFKGQDVILWIHPDGKESLFKDETIIPAARVFIEAGYAVVGGDLFGAGDLKLAKPFAVNTTYAGFTYGYNRSLLAQRVHDILTMIGFATTVLKASNVRLIGWGKAGPWAALAHALAGSAVAKSACELGKFDFANVKKTDDEMMLPGALKYGGMPAFIKLIQAEAFKNIETRKDMEAMEWLLKNIPR